MAAVSEPALGSLRHPLTRVLLVLTFTTAIVDALSYLGLGRGFAVIAPLISLGALVLGAGAGGTLAQRLSERRPRGAGHDNRA